MIFIFIAINHIISLKQTNLYFGHVRQKFSLRVLLSFCSIFVNFSLVLLIKVLLFKKSVYIRNKKFKVAKCEHFFRVGWVTGSRGTFFKKETPTQVLSCEYCGIVKNIFFTKHLWITASYFNALQYPAPKAVQY